jgi:hypothetical protein
MNFCWSSHELRKTEKSCDGDILWELQCKYVNNKIINMSEETEKLK